MTTKERYMIYRLFNEELDDMITQFFLPDDSVRRRLNRFAQLQVLKEKGYLVMGILYVDKSSYLNARLTETVNEYIENDKAEQETKKRYNRGEISYQIAFRTLELVQDRKWSLLKRVHKQVNRMIEEEVDINNEIALMLNDEYLKAIL